MFNVKFADIGEGIHEGVVFKMHAVEGAEITEGEILFLVETDKVTAEITSPVDGVISKVNVAEGDEIYVGNTIIVIDDGLSGFRSNMQVDEEEMQENNDTAINLEKEDKTIGLKKEKEEKEESGASVVGEIEVSSELISSSKEAKAEIVVSKAKKVLATPVARKLAKDLKIDIQTLIGSGPAGRIMKKDIYAANEKKELKVKVEPARKIKPSKSIIESSEEVTRVPMTMIRKAISENMVKSKFTIPHTVVMDEVDVTELVEFRNSAKEMLLDEGVKITYLSLIIKGVAIALKKHAILNSSLDEEKQEIVMKRFVNIGIAVDTPQGLIVPVIKRTDYLSVIEIAAAIKDLSGRAQEKKLKLDEIKGSTFTVTNYGAFGASFGVPIINYPDAAVLGIGLIVKKPIVIDDKIVIRHMLPLSMSFDHRIVDGADAGRFMLTLKKLLSTSKLLLLS
ncbi:MAG: dihydrolipoamide acetyltransferase family protein [Alkaliphilus sp.]